jgi:hypothetical protein
MSTPRRLILAAGALLLLAVVAAAPNLLGSGRGGEAGPVARTAPTSMRTLIVSARRSPAPSRPGTTMRALRLSGVVPRTAAVGTVVSDDDCAPDAAGISHCVNRIRMANGRMLSVRHPHRMAEVPCMTPGERVQVRAV